MNPPVQLSSLDAAPQLPPGPLHLAIGMFDGVHQGHRAVIEAAVRGARESGGVAAVLTFWPHPSALFRPDEPTRLIQDPATKATVLLELGVDAVITEPFTFDLACVPASEFLPWLQRRASRLAAVYVGENFRYGHNRRGDIEHLKFSGRGRGVRVFSAPRINYEGEPISSTRIRALLEQGEIEAANALLGYPYFAQGIVTPGKRLGRTIGFPTLNIPWAPALPPRFGVYAVRVRGAQAPEGLPAVANYGLRPTVENSTQPRLEVHVLGECPFGEGDRVRVEWLRFLRPEQKFANLDELRAQIGRDRAAAASFFKVA